MYSTGCVSHSCSPRAISPENDRAARPAGRQPIEGSTNGYRRRADSEAGDGAYQTPRSGSAFGDRRERPPSVLRPRRSETKGVRKSLPMSGALPGWGMALPRSRPWPEGLRCLHILRPQRGSPISTASPRPSGFRAFTIRPPSGRSGLRGASSRPIRPVDRASKRRGHRRLAQEVSARPANRHRTSPVPEADRPDRSTGASRRDRLGPD